MKMYKTSNYRVAEIQEIDVDHKTEEYYWIDGRRMLRETYSGCVAETWHEAKRWLLGEWKGKLRTAASQVKQAKENGLAAKKEIDRINGMVNPTEEG